MRIAVAQINTRAGDFGAALEKMAQCDAMARASAADLLVFPAPVFMGCDPMALADDPAYVADVTAALADLSGRFRVPAIVPFVAGLYGTPTADAVFVHDGVVMPVSVGNVSSVLGSLSALAGGDGEAPARPPLMLPPVIEVANVTVGLAFSNADLEAFASGIAIADVVCFIPFEGFSTDDEASCLAPSVSDGCYIQTAKEIDSWLVGVNAAGAWEDRVFVGGSFVMAPWGELAAVAHSFTEDFLVCDIDFSSEGPLADPVDPPYYDRSRILWEAAVIAVRDQMEKRELSGIVVVADGSLSSAATVALATDAAGPMRVHALVCGEGEALADARELVRSLRIRDVDVLSARDLERAAESLGGEGSQRLATSLVQARLGAWAQEANLLALSCADKTELAVGRSDDGPAPAASAEAFAPLGDVYRSDVARVARYRNTVSPVVPAGSLVRLDVPQGLGLEELATSDELRLSELDAALLLHLERGAGLTELARGKWGEKRVARLFERLRRAGAARRQGPRYPLLSSRSLAEGATPLTDAWRDRLREEPPAMPSYEELAASLGPLADELSQEGGVDFAKLLSDTFGEAFGKLGEDVGASASADAGAAGAKAPGIQGAGAAGATRHPSGAPGFAGSSDPAMRSHISELMGYLQELSDGKRMRGEQDGANGEKDIWRGLFSDN